MGIEWLNERAPGFANLSKQEKDLLLIFPLLWSLFESRILNNSANADQIFKTVCDWHEQQKLELQYYDDAVAYFKQRYFCNGQATSHYYHLNLRANDHPKLVEAVLLGKDNNPAHKFSAVLIIIYRFRNNLFHGPKWEYQLADQKSNFEHANSVLISVLEKYGHL